MPLSGLILEAEAPLESQIDLKYLLGLEGANKPAQVRLVVGLNLLALNDAIPWQAALPSRNSYFKGIISCPAGRNSCDDGGRAELVPDIVLDD